MTERGFVLVFLLRPGVEIRQRLNAASRFAAIDMRVLREQWVEDCWRPKKRLGAEMLGVMQQTIENHSLGINWNGNIAICLCADFNTSQ